MKNKIAIKFIENNACEKSFTIEQWRNYVHKTMLTIGELHHITFLKVYDKEAFCFNSNNENESENDVMMRYCTFAKDVNVSLLTNIEFYNSVFNFDFNYSSFSRCVFNNCTFKFTSDNHLHDASFHITAFNSRFNKCSFSGNDEKNLKILLKFENSTFDKCNFFCYQLIGDIIDCKFHSCDFSDIIFRSSIKNSKFTYCNFYKAYLRSDDYKKVSGINPYFINDLYSMVLMSKSDDSIYAFKLVSRKGKPIWGSKQYIYKVGETYTENDFDDNIFQGCSNGFNVATLSWILDVLWDYVIANKNKLNEYKLFKVSIDKKDIVAIPIVEESGKFRVKKFKVEKEVNIYRLFTHGKYIEKSKK